MHTNKMKLFSFKSGCVILVEIGKMRRQVRIAIEDYGKAVLAGKKRFTRPSISLLKE